MKLRLAICFALCGLLALPVLAGPASKADFAVMYADALELGAGDATSAIRALQERGLVGAQYNAQGELTYGDLVEVFNLVGVDATSSTPDLVVDDGVLDGVVTSLAPSTLDTMGDGGGDDKTNAPNNNGRKRRPKGQTPNSRANPNAFYGRDEG
jgi:hypothetical protein